MGLLVVGLASPGIAQAASGTHSYPTRPIRLIVPFAPGGATDLLARTVGHKLTEAWGQQVIIDNRPGVGGSIAGELTARAAPDGQTIMLVSISNAIAASSSRKLPYDLLKDFTPIIFLASSPQALTVHAAVPARSVKELVALARSQPGKMNFASSGTGGGTHMVGELFKSAARIDIVHVPYKGAGPALVDVVAGHADMLFTGIVAAIPHAKGGRLRLLAVTTGNRTSAAPDVPTMGEAGYPAVEAGSWYGLVAPAAVNGEIVRRLNIEIGRLLNDDQFRRRLAADGSTAVGGTPAEFGNHIRAEMAKWTRVVSESGIVIQ